MAPTSEKKTDEPHIIYCVTNKVNGKKYVGLTKWTIERRWKWHCTESTSSKTIEKSKLNRDRVILRAIRKYGKDGFNLEVVDNASNLDAARELEKHWIKKMNSKIPNGYNLTDGGEGTIGWDVPDWRRAQLSEANSGEKNYWYGKRGDKHFGYGKKLSEEHIETLKKNNSNNKEVTVNGVTYRSKNYAAECLNVSKCSIERLMNWQSEVAKIQHQFVEFDGIEYCGIKEAARQLNTSKYLLERRISRGEGKYVDKQWTFESFCDYLRNLRKGMVSVEYKGKKYRSILQLCKTLRMDKDVVGRLMRDGEVREISDRIYRESATSIPVKFEGVVYPSKTYFMEDFSISGKEFKRLVDEGIVEVLIVT